MSQPLDSAHSHDGRCRSSVVGAQHYLRASRSHNRLLVVHTFGLRALAPVATVTRYEKGPPLIVRNGPRDDEKALNQNWKRTLKSTTRGRTLVVGTRYVDPTRTLSVNALLVFNTLNIDADGVVSPAGPDRQSVE